MSCSKYRWTKDCDTGPCHGDCDRCFRNLEGEDEPSDLISRQAAIDALGDEPEVWTGKDEYAQGLNNQWHYDVNALKAVPSAQPEQRWIPCSETGTQPPVCDDVIVSIRDEAGDTRFDYSSVGWKTPDGEYWIVDNEVNRYVIAWQPLPEPYKDGENG